MGIYADLSNGLVSSVTNSSTVACVFKPMYAKSSQTEMY